MAGTLSLALLAVAMIAGRAAAAPPVAAFKKMPFDKGADHIALSEDGKFLAAGNDSWHRLWVWDVRAEKVVKTLSCPVAGSILWRGDRVYVAATRCRIVVLAPNKDWELVDELEVGEGRPGIPHLAAPQGKYFDGHILAEYKGKLVLVNAKDDTHRVVTKHAFAPRPFVDFEGHYFFARAGNDGHIGGPYDLRAAVAGKELPQPPPWKRAMPQLRQVREGPYWFGSNLVYKGSPPVLMGQERGKLVVPDSTANCFYVLDRGSLRSMTVSDRPVEIGSRDATYPADFNRLRPRDDRFYDRALYEITDAECLAFTEGKVLRLFLLDSGMSMIFTCTTPAFDVPSGAAPGGAASPLAQEDAFPKQVTAGRPLAFNLLPQGGQGQFRLISAPPGVTVSDSGVLAWTPRPDDVGPQRLKVRVRVGGKFSFLRIQTEVVPFEEPAGVMEPRPAARPKPRRHQPWPDPVEGNRGARGRQGRNRGTHSQADRAPLLGRRGADSHQRRLGQRHGHRLRGLHPDLRPRGGRRGRAGGDLLDRPGPGAAQGGSQGGRVATGRERRPGGAQDQAPRARWRRSGWASARRRKPASRSR